MPVMNAVVDNPDGTRTITLEVNGTTTAMPDTQTARLTGSRWISPNGAEGQIISREVTTRLNGEVVEDSTTIPEEPPDPNDPTQD